MEPESTGRRDRASYLFDGRRVAVRDLLDNGFLVTGQQLSFVRPRSGGTHVAVVDDRGFLLVEGRRHATPSGAVWAAVGVHVDGWTAWVTESGDSLHSLRMRLLDRAAVESSEPAEQGDEEEAPSESPMTRHDFLKEALDAATRGTPATITVRELVRHWGAYAWPSMTT
jgi:hypothetical protein